MSEICPLCNREMKQSHHDSTEYWGGYVTCEEQYDCVCGYTYEFAYGAMRELYDGEKFNSELYEKGALIVDLYVNVVGTYYHKDTVPLNVGDFVILRREPENQYDKDAVAVYNTANEKVGFVSNSDRTVTDGCKKASYIRTRVPDLCPATIFFKKDNVIIAKVNS